jgi:hypothetical protein
MNQESKTKRDGWWVTLMAVAYIGTAWLLAGGQWVYPPIPMFTSALVGGWLFRGRPQTAVRASLWTGLVWSWLAEWAYFYVRLSDPAGTWAKTGFWECLGLGAAEVTLYTALLSFFAAFIAWGSEKSKTVQAGLPADPGESVFRKPEIPFAPEDTQFPDKRTLFKNQTPRKPDSF